LEWQSIPTRARKTELETGRLPLVNDR